MVRCHSVSHFFKHHKVLKYHLAVNHKTKYIASYRNSVSMEVLLHFTKDQIMLRHSVLTYAG